MNIRNIYLGIALVFALIVSACGDKNNSQLQSENAVEQSSGEEQTTASTDVGNAYDAILDEYEVLIEKNNELICRVEKGDSSAVAEQMELQKKREDLEAREKKLNRQDMTQEQLDRLATLQKKQREETTSR